eukprot:scaffold2916_cov80-Cylindrotheca_fusiformis.AAC.2
MRSLRMPCGKTKEHIPIGPLWRRHRHRLNDVEMLSLNVSPHPVVDLGTSWKPPRSHRLLLSCKPCSTPVDTQTSQRPQPSSAVPQTCDGQTVPYRMSAPDLGKITRYVDDSDLSMLQNIFNN